MIIRRIVFGSDEGFKIQMDTDAIKAYPFSSLPQAGGRQLKIASGYFEQREGKQAARFHEKFAKPSPLNERKALL